MTNTVTALANLDADAAGVVALSNLDWLAVITALLSVATEAIVADQYGVAGQAVALVEKIIEQLSV